MRTAQVFRLSMAHPGDLSELDRLIASGTVRAADVVAIIGKTEGNGGVNDFTRGYFTQTLMALLSRHLNRPAEQLIREIPCVLSGGTEGVMSPHYSVFCVSEGEATQAAGIVACDRHRVQRAGAGRGCRPARACRQRRRCGARGDRECRDRTAGRRAFRAGQMPLRDGGARRRRRSPPARRRSPTIPTSRWPLPAPPARSALRSRSTRLKPSDFDDASLLSDFSIQSPRASISSGVEVESNEVIVLGNSPHWAGHLRIAHRPMTDALDIGGVVDVLADLGIAANPQVSRRRCRADRDRAGQMRAGPPRQNSRQSAHHARRHRHQRAAPYPRRGRGPGRGRDRRRPDFRFRRRRASGPRRRRPDRGDRFAARGAPADADRHRRRRCRGMRDGAQAVAA